MSSYVPLDTLPLFAAPPSEDPVVHLADPDDDGVWLARLRDRMRAPLLDEQPGERLVKDDGEPRYGELTGDAALAAWAERRRAEQPAPSEPVAYRLEFPSLNDRRHYYEWHPGDVDKLARASLAKVTPLYAALPTHEAPSLPPSVLDVIEASGEVLPSPREETETAEHLVLRPCHTCGLDTWFPASTTGDVCNSCARGSEGWRPIETAPRDGTRVLLWSPDAIPYLSVFIGWWCVEETWPGGGAWVESEDAPNPIDADATHWLPLPAAPEVMK